MNQITGILPLKIGESNKSNSCELADILLRSLEFFSEKNLFKNFFIVTPHSQFTYIRSYFNKKYKKLNVIVVDEEVMFPELVNYRNVNGWQKQQTIKLAMSNYIDTDFFIVFDADVVCKRRLSFERIVHDNKSLIQIGEDVHPSYWWNCSKKILGCEGFVVPRTMFFTPAILSTQVCLSLIKYIERNINFFEILRIVGWTEFTLYNTFIEKNNLLDQYHFTTHDQLVSKKWSGIHKFDRDCIIQGMGDDALFTVIQSSLNVDIGVVQNIFYEIALTNHDRGRITPLC